MCGWRAAERDLRVMVNSRLSMNQWCALADKRAKHISGCIKHIMAGWSKEVILLLFLAGKRAGRHVL